jgi:REP element-mobilizing transposase RayT
MKRRSNCIRVPIHFVWATHERLPLIEETVQRRLWRYIEATCREMRCEVLAVGGVSDHIHLLVNFPSTLSFAELMKRVKGGSSRFASQELHDGQWFQWQTHYGAFAVSFDEVDAVIAYIAHQKQHHADGAIRADWEQTYDEYDIEAEASAP